jgi:cbb3-type cytochrome oxidase maturation protein
MFVVAGLIFVSLTLAVAFLAAFIWAVKSGQFEDVYTPSLRVLIEDTPPKAVSEVQTKSKRI